MKMEMLDMFEYPIIGEGSHGVKRIRLGWGGGRGGGGVLVFVEMVVL